MSYRHNFRARMPRENPEAGKSYIVFSIKSSQGNRAEFEGTIAEDTSFTLLQQIIGLICETEGE